MTEAICDEESYHVPATLGLEAVGDLLETGGFADFSVLNVLAFPVPLVGGSEAPLASCSSQGNSMTLSPTALILTWWFDVGGSERFQTCVRSI